MQTSFLDDVNNGHILKFDSFVGSELFGLIHLLFCPMIIFQVKVPVLAMRGGSDLQTYVDILVPSNAKLTLIKVPRDNFSG